MAITVLTLDELRARALAAVRLRFQGRSTHAESWLGKQADALANIIWSVHEQVQQADRDATPQDRSTIAALATWAFVLGLPDGAGGYGPKGATAATGLTASATGTPAAVIWNGIAPSPQLVAPDGETFFELSAAVSLDGSGHATLAMNAVTPGTGGNLSTGATLNFVSSIPGVDAGVTVISGAINGTNDESKADLLARLLLRLQNPPKAGTSPDWRAWAKAIAGVDEAYVYPRRDGTGTVFVVATQAGSGAGRQPSASIIAAILAAFDANRLVCVEGRGAQAPYMPAGAAVAVRIRAIPTSGNAFDWDSSAGTWTVDLFTTPNLRLSTLAPADLKAAIDAGQKPRLQVQLIGSALPFEVRCGPAGSWSDGGGKTTIVLDDPTGFTPLVGDAVRAGGNAVGPVADGVLALVDSLGPSRISGYADREWEDVLRVDALIEIAMAAADDSGARLVRDLVGDPTINGTAVNVLSLDNDSNGPQMLYLASVVVTP